MELWQAIFANMAKKYEKEILEYNIENLFEKECYVLLRRIQTVLEDDSLDDKDCFEKIETLICLFEETGSDCGARHDFG